MLENLISGNQQHWRRQLLVRVPLDLQQFIFSVYFDQYKVWQRLYVDNRFL